MLQITTIEPVDYLVIGHLTVDLTPDGLRLGGTAAYSGLTARALGMRVGIVTSFGDELPLDLLGDIQVVNAPTDKSSTFENIYTSKGRVQVVRSIAEKLDYYHVPEAWRVAPIVHLGPIAQEVEPAMVRNFPSSFLGITPQGWLRAWDSEGHVVSTEWPEASFVLGQCGATVLSVEDVSNSEERIEEMTSSCHMLAVTEAYQGARLYWNGDVRRFRPPVMDEVDATGAGDVFAAAFFTRLYSTRDPWESARFATQLSAYSVLRKGLASIPTAEEINACMVEVF